MDFQRRRYGTDHTNTIVISGQGVAGRTKTEENLKRRYGCNSIIDEWSFSRPLTEGALHLTNEDMPLYWGGAYVVKFPELISI